MSDPRKANSSRQNLAVFTYLKQKKHCFYDHEVHILDREDRRFEKVTRGRRGTTISCWEYHGWLQMSGLHRSCRLQALLPGSVRVPTAVQTHISSRTRALLADFLQTSRESTWGADFTDCDYPQFIAIQMWSSFPIANWKAKRTYESVKQLLYYNVTLKWHTPI